AAAPLLLSPGERWRIRDARALGDPDMRWQCPHEAVGILLGMVLARARRTGHVALQLRAAELCLALPVGPDDEERLQLQLAKARALLN
ncbi:MAG TPA: hypothetical protein VHB30_14350, partial [Solirubrobacteraceae bacterium]|nr:hypothetical protein [Solirubrobacteraceae bacterium]